MKEALIRNLEKECHHTKEYQAAMKDYKEAENKKLNAHAQLLDLFTALQVKVYYG